MKRKGPTTLGETQHGMQARDVYRHKPLPALEAEQERQVLDEFRALERVTNALRGDLEDIQGGSGVDRKAESIPGSGQTIEAAVNAHTFVDAHADSGVIVVDKSTLLTIGYDNVAYEYVGPTEVEVGAGVGPGTWPKRTTNATDWIATSSNDHKILADRDAADQHPQTAIGGRSGHANLELDQNSQDSRISALEAASGAGAHNDLSGRSAINSHPMAAITGLQTGGSTTLFLNANGTYTAPPGFTGNHNDLPGLTASNAHPLASITGIQTGGAGDAWLDNKGQYSAPPSGGAAEPYGYITLRPRDFIEDKTGTLTGTNSNTAELLQFASAGNLTAFEMIAFGQTATDDHATAMIPVPYDYAWQFLRIKILWWANEAATNIGESVAFSVKVAIEGDGTKITNMVYPASTSQIGTVQDNMQLLSTITQLPSNNSGFTRPMLGAGFWIQIERPRASYHLDTLPTWAGIANVYIQYQRVTTPSTQW